MYSLKRDVTARFEQSRQVALSLKNDVVPTLGRMLKVQKIENAQICASGKQLRKEVKGLAEKLESVELIVVGETQG